MARPTRASRGLFTRLVGLLLGAAVGAGLCVATVLPVLGRPARVEVSTHSLGPVAEVPWPASVSAALGVPSLGVLATHLDRVRPVASLTKMMTALVSVTALPLRPGQDGPCLVVGPADVADYLTRRAQGQSYAAVAVGEQLCERQLLEGLLVPSANNFAILLARLVSGGVEPFVARMNAEAAALGLDHTHYVEPSGFAAGSVSTAADQAHLAEALMAHPTIAAIVDQPTVTLPVAGTLSTFTPDVGVDGVIGVKSGRTDAAGGCVVMALHARLAGRVRTVYAVVLGARGGDLLTPAGEMALGLASASHRALVERLLPARIAWATAGFGRGQVGIGLAHPAALWTWRGRLGVRVEVGRLVHGLHRGQRVGWLVLRGLRTHRLPLVALGSLSRPTLLERLR